MAWTSSKLHLTFKCPRILLTAELQPKSDNIISLLRIFQWEIQEKCKHLSLAQWFSYSRLPRVYYTNLLRSCYFMIPCLSACRSPYLAHHLSYLFFFADKFYLPKQWSSSFFWPTKCKCPSTGFQYHCRWTSIEAFLKLYSNSDELHKKRKYNLVFPE